MSPPPPADPPAAAPAEELAAIRRRVLNVIGHELRTPVTTIHGLARAVTDADDLEAVTTQVGPALLRNAERLSALLDDLLIASGIQTAIPVDVPEPVQILDLLSERWAEVADGRLAISGPPIIVMAPRPLLVRAVDAVLANAAQYGSDPPTVTVTDDGDRVGVRVHSPGPALHPEEVRLATEAFFRGERAVTTRPGLGVGLAIARTLVLHLGGDLGVHAEDDGLVTTMALPGGTTA